VKPETEVYSMLPHIELATHRERLQSIAVNNQLKI
jgi:hypothetical protein